MTIRVLLVSLACLISSCSSDPAPSPDAGPTGRLAVTNPTSGDTYTTLSDSIGLSGIRDPAVSSVGWVNRSTGATGTGYTLDYPDWCFFFGYYQCTRYEWGAAVPLQDGENEIRVTADGSWADSLTVFRTPSSDVSGSVIFGGIGQLNIRLTLADRADPSAVRTAFTDTAGSYRFSLITAGTYSLVPSDACYAFSPAEREVTVAGTDIPGLDFIVNAKPAAVVGGRVTWLTGGSAVYDAAVRLTDAGAQTERATVRTSPQGYYTFTCVPDGAYTVDVLPAFQGFTLLAAPSSAGVTVSGSDIMNIDFQASIQ